MANSTDKSILTAAGKALLAQLNAEEKALVIDKMIFANVPNRPEYPQPDDVVPTDHIVHQEQVEQRGRLSADSVIYSSTLTSDVGPFDFNWTGAYCSEYGVLVTIDHHALTPKTADEPGVAGNTLVRSVVLEYKDIAEITNITVDASSWQYNATERMKKMDSDVAQSIIDQNGKDWFIEDGFLVTLSGSAYSIKAGAGYVSGNRVAMEFDRSVQVPNKPSFIYIDAHREGTPTGEQVTLFNFVVTAEEKDDYIDSSTGKDVKHFVCKIAQVLADGSVSDLRPSNQMIAMFDEGDSYRQQETIGLTIENCEVGTLLNTGEAVRFFKEHDLSSRVFKVFPSRGGVVDMYDLNKKIIKINGNYSRLIKATEETKSVAQINNFKPSSTQYFNNNLIKELTTDEDASYSGGDGRVYFYAPTACVLPSGRVLVAYTAKYGVDIDPGQIHDCKMGIHLKISDDNAQSFLTKKIVDKPSPFQCAESVIYYNHLQKRVYVFYTSFKGKVGWGFSEQGTDEDTSSQVEFVFSDDNGDTWSNPVNITSMVKPDEAYLIFTPPTKIAMNKRGEMMIPIAYTESKNTNVVETYVYQSGERWLLGETITKEDASKTGGEIGFGKYPDGNVFAISRTWEDNDSLEYRTSIHKLYDELNGEWVLKGSFETSDCKSSWFTIGNNDGFDGFKLLFVAPIGVNGHFESRKNLRCFDATSDFSNPIDLGMISPSIQEYAGYSDLLLMANGCMLCLFDGRQWKVHLNSFTLNKLVGAQGEMVPCHGMKLVDNLDQYLRYDVHENEQVMLTRTNEVFIYRLADFENINAKKQLEISSVVSNIDANLGEVFYFNSGSQGSLIGEILNGYSGQQITLVSLSGSVDIELERLKQGAGQNNRIMFDNKNMFTDSGNKVLSRMVIKGGTESGESMTTLTKTEYGWYSNMTANTEA
ncbi:TPA: phage tail protein [Vibrio parahaemolyticus]